MTPAPPPPPTDDSVDVNDVLNAGKPENEGLDPDSLDADFEQELEDLFSDDLEEDGAAADEGDDEPIVLDEYVTVENDGNVEDDPMTGSNDLDGSDDELLLLDDLADEDDPMLLDDPAEPLSQGPAQDAGDDDMAALLDDIAEDNAPEAEPDAEEVIELDDLLDEGDDLADLDALLAEADEVQDTGGDADLDVLDEPLADADALESDEGDEGDVLLLDDTLADDTLLEEAMTDEAMSGDLMDAALAEDAHADLPVEESVPEDELDLLMDEPEGADQGDISDLTGLDSLDEDMEDMDSLLDNVEVDVSGVVSDVVSGQDETGDEAGSVDFADLVDDNLADADVADADIDMGISGSDMADVLTAEAMPPDAGVDVSDDVDVDQLLADVRTESASVAAAVPGPASASVAELQEKVARLEARVAELETRIRQEIASLLPAEAARIIREEIAALAREMDDQATDSFRKKKARHSARCSAKVWTF